MLRAIPRNLLVWSCLVIWLAAAAIACGPFFPIRLLADADDSVLSAPAADFHVEIRGFVPGGNPPFASAPPNTDESVLAQSAKVDATDLDAAMAAMGTPEERRAEIVSQYRLLRARLADESAKSVIPAPPAGLPDEFTKYIDGMIAYRRHDLRAARTEWQSLLALPAGQRNYKTVWAAFMLGKSHLDENPAQSLPWFAAARKFAADGFSDSLGLAASSLGWEARADLKMDRFADAIHLYLMQEATGDPTAVNSLRDVAGDIVTRYPGQLSALASDTECRGVITAYFTSEGDRFSNWDGAKRKPQIQFWLNAIESAGVQNLAGADRLAWAAYQAGDMQLASSWLNRAAADSAVAHWIRAKLLIRNGRVPAAAAELDKAINAFPTNVEWPQSRMPEDDLDAPDAAVFHPRQRVQGELAVLDLSRHQYADALSLFLAGGYWQDAAYIAERVLTPDELLNFIQTRGSDICTDTFGERHSLRYLAARRMMRLTRFADARPLFPDEAGQFFRQYAAGLKSGRDGTLPAGQRAQSLWTAAKIAHDHGMEIMGTELDPDDFIFGGDFQLGDWSKPLASPMLGLPAADESKRVKVSAGELPFDKRFEYRYVASDLAWEAAVMMPDESDVTAHVLFEAGSWLKNRDAKSADRFYKALVNRCGSTKLGQEARRVRWFPTTAP